MAEVIASSFRPLYLNSFISQPSSPQKFPFTQLRFNQTSGKTIPPLRMAQSSSVGNPGVELQRVLIPNKNGEKLVGLFHDTGSKEIVVLCHGFRSSKESETMANLAYALGKEGISVFRFDFSGNGESEGEFQYGNYYGEADELRSVVQHFYGANRAVAAILGHSKGGGVVLLYASKYGDIRTVINVAGRYDLKAGIEERFGKDYKEKVKKDGYVDVKNKTGGGGYRVTYESLMDRVNTDMHKACLQIDKECRILTIHGTADKTVPVEDAYEFAKIIPNHKLHIFEGADHKFTKNQPELASIVVDFVKTGLQEDKASPN